MQWAAGRAGRRGQEQGQAGATPRVRQDDGNPPRDEADALVAAAHHAATTTLSNRSSPSMLLCCLLSFILLLSSSVAPASAAAAAAAASSGQRASAPVVASPSAGRAGGTAAAPSDSHSNALSFSRRTLAGAYRWGTSQWTGTDSRQGRRGGAFLGDGRGAAPAAGRALDDFVLGDIVVVSSIEGGVYGIDRASGTTRWSLPPRVPLAAEKRQPQKQQNESAADDASSVDDLAHKTPPGFGPIVAQAYGPAKRTFAELAANVPLNETLSAPGSETSADSQDTSGHEALDALQELGMYVVEPSSGQLYLLTSAPTSATRAGGKSTLSKLPMTLPQLVDLSPFSFPGDASRVFVGHKRTSLVEIDIASGQIGAVFGGSSVSGDDADRWCNAEGPFRAFREQQQSASRNESCTPDADQSVQWAYMGRTDYTLTVYLRGRPSLSQTLHFSTFSPNAADRDIADLWLRRGEYVDQRVLMGMPEEGSVICFNGSHSDIGSRRDQQDRTLWINKLGVTVAGIFDVAYQLEVAGNDKGSTQAQAQAHPIILPHPSTSLRSLFADLPSHLGERAGMHGSFDSIVERQTTYLGMSNGHLYAMGHENYPLAAFTPRAMAALGGPNDEHYDHHSNGQHHEGHPSDGRTSLCAARGCLIGSYDTDSTASERSGDLLGLGPGHAPLLGIGDGHEQRANGSHPSENRPLSDEERASPQVSTSASSWTSPSMVMTQIIALFLLAILCGLIYIGGHELQRQRADEARAITRDMVWTPQVSQSESSRMNDLSSTIERPHANGNGAAAPAPSEGISRAGADTLTPSEPPLNDDDLQRLIEGGQEKKKPAKRRRRGKRAGMTVAQREAKRDGSKEDGLVADEESEDERDEPIDENVKGENTLGPSLHAKSNGTTAVTGVSDGLTRASQALEGHQLPVLASADTMSAEGGSTVPLQNGDNVAARGENRSLIISEEVLGYGSSGTLVFKGTFQGRAVAVKRLLRDFVDVASKEVTLLESADNHPNVIRYFYKEVTSSFLFIALELCPASLADIIEKPHEYQELSALLQPKKALHQIASGLHHLHSLSIVHRDIKPQNILVSPKNGRLKMLLSDFGLSKRLDGVAQSSFSQTVNNPGGTVGWRAPEILRGDVTVDAGADGNSTNSSANTARPETSDGAEGSSAERGNRLTRAVDIFALGCLAYYVLSNGDHPFGSRFEREMNILRKHLELARLDGLGEEGHEAQHMITQMVCHDPKQRPTALHVLSHPYFWDAGRRLCFLQDASDRFDIMERDPPAPALVALEEGATVVLGGQDWHKRVDRQVMEDLNKRRKYDAKSVSALLRAIRNKKHHIHDCPPSVRRLFVLAGGASIDQNKLLPDGFLAYFTTRFPKLFLHVYEVVDAMSALKTEAAFAPYFVPAHEDE